MSRDWQLTCQRATFRSVGTNNMGSLAEDGVFRKIYKTGIPVSNMRSDLFVVWTNTINQNKYDKKMQALQNYEVK